MAPPWATLTWGPQPRVPSPHSSPARASPGLQSDRSSQGLECHGGRRAAGVGGVELTSTEPALLRSITEPPGS